jgi:hypothetical protein
MARFCLVLGLGALAIGCGGRERPPGLVCGTGADAGSGSGGAAGASGAGGAATPDGGGGSFDDGFDLRSVPGLVFWLDAAQGVGALDTGEVVFWADQVTPADELPSSDPMSVSYQNPGPTGHPEVILPAQTTMTSLLGINGVALGTGDFLVEVVGSWNFGTIVPSFVEIDGMNDASGHTRGFFIAPNVVPDGPGGASTSILGGATLRSHTPFDARAPHLIGARRWGAGTTTTLALRVDGAYDSQQTDSSYGHDLDQSALINLGPDVALSEVIIVRGIITDQDLAKLEGHLLSKYGLR